MKRSRLPNATIAMWGGVGKPGHRPFLEWCSRVEKNHPAWEGQFVTWTKRRAYGTATKYLFTREECFILTRGKPVFNKPYLDKERGYAGYDKKVPGTLESFLASRARLERRHGAIQGQDSSLAKAGQALRNHCRSALEGKRHRLRSRCRKRDDSACVPNAGVVEFADCRTGAGLLGKGKVDMSALKKLVSNVSIRPSAIPGVPSARR